MSTRSRTYSNNQHGEAPEIEKLKIPEWTTGRGNTLPEIGTAWLVLSHAGFLAAAITASTLGTSFLLFFNGSDFRHLIKPLAIGWITAALLICAFGIYAVITTWNAARKFENRIFHDFGFVFLTVVFLYVTAASIWSLVVVSEL